MVTYGSICDRYCEVIKWSVSIVMTLYTWLSNKCSEVLHYMSKYAIMLHGMHCKELSQAPSCMPRHVMILHTTFYTNFFPSLTTNLWCQSNQEYTSFTRIVTSHAQAGSQNSIHFTLYCKQIQFNLLVELKMAAQFHS